MHEEVIKIEKLESNNIDDVVNKINEIIIAINILNITVRGNNRNEMQDIFIEPLVEEGVDIVNELLKDKFDMPRRIRKRRIVREKRI